MQCICIFVHNREWVIVRGVCDDMDLRVLECDNNMKDSLIWLSLEHGNEAVRQEGADKVISPGC